MSKRERKDDVLRDAFSSPDPAAGSTAHCPGDGEIWSASRGELPPERTELLLAHSLECTECRQSWQAAAALAAEGKLDESGRSGGAAGEASGTASRPQDPAAGRVIPFRSRHHRLVAAITAVAAMLVMMFALTTMLDREPDQVAPLSLAEQIQTDIWRVGESQPLADGDPLSLGDRIYLTLESDIAVHLYLINKDQAGESAALFPIQGAQWSNPLPPGVTHRLPGDQDWQYDSWEVTSTGGRESFTVVASLEPLPRLEAALALVGGAMPQDQILRGQSTLPPGSETDPDQAAAALAGALEELHRESFSHSVLVREIVLENSRTPDS
jgi:hypothetical protein